MRDANQVKHAGKYRGQNKHYCSSACHNLAQRRPKPTVTGACNHCGITFTRVSSTGGGYKDKVAFCSTRCVALSHAAVRAGTGARVRFKCPKCGATKSESGTQCRRCQLDEFNSRTVGELRSTYGTAEFHAKVRGLARDAYVGDRYCSACGYDLHVDICHLRPVADFPNSATLAEVNHPSNLVALDKRCHWEMDNGYLIRIENGWISKVRWETVWR